MSMDQSMSMHEFYPQAAMSYPCGNPWPEEYGFYCDPALAHMNWAHSDVVDPSMDFAHTLTGSLLDPPCLTENKAMCAEAKEFVPAALKATKSPLGEVTNFLSTSPPLLASLAAKKPATLAVPSLQKVNARSTAPVYIGTGILSPS